MANETIFIVEDEEDILELISYNLIKDGYRTKGFLNGEDLLSALKKGNADLIILDLMLPGIDGLEVCKDIKKNKETEDIPVIMVTAKGEEADIVIGLELGADDYIVKPFSPRILIARVKTVLRRKKQVNDISRDNISIKGIEINPGRHEVLVEGEKVELTASEFSALHFLACRPGWVFTRYQIVENVHGYNYPVTDRSIDVLMVSIRKKLGRAGSNIETVRGIGYRFKD